MATPCRRKRVRSHPLPILDTVLRRAVLLCYWIAAVVQSACFFPLMRARYVGIVHRPTIDLLAWNRYRWVLFRWILVCIRLWHRGLLRHQLFTRPWSSDNLRGPGDGCAHLLSV